MQFRSVVLVADVPNKNKHIYPKHLLEDVVRKFKDVVANRGLIGQIGYPKDSCIYFDQASHLITELVVEDDKLMASIEVLDTPCGRVLKEMLKDESKVALRPYGVGSGEVDENGNLVLDDSYKMVSISVVEADKAA